MNGIGFGGSSNNVIIYQMAKAKQEEERKKKAEFERQQQTAPTIQYGLPPTTFYTVPTIYQPAKHSQPAFKGAFTSLWLANQIDDSAKKQQVKLDALQKQQEVILQQQQFILRALGYYVPVVPPSVTKPHNVPRFGDSSLFWILQYSAQSKKLKAKEEELKQKDAIIQQQQTILQALGYPCQIMVPKPIPEPKATPRFGDLTTATAGLIRDIRHEREMKQQERQVRQEARQELIQELQQKGYLSPLIPAQMFLNQPSVPTQPYASLE